MKEKTRDEVEIKYTWDLNTIYESDEHLLNDYNKIKEEIAKIKLYEETFCLTAENLYNMFVFYDQIAMNLDKIWTFVSHRFDTDITNNYNQEWKDKVSNLYEDFSLNTSFVVPQLLKLGYKQIEQYYLDFPKLKEEYSFNLEEIFRNENHILSETEEKLISSLGKAFSNTQKIATMLTDSDVVFGEIMDENGKMIELNDTNYIIYMTSKNRDVRKSAFEKLYSTYKQFNNTLALLLSSEIERKVTMSKIRKYNSSMEAALFSDNISVDVYNNLINTVSENLQPLYDYYELKRKILKLDEFHLYDVYVEIANKTNNKYTFEEAKQIVIDSLKILGDDYNKILNKAFSERWIDIYPNKGKRGGAYSGGSYLTNPFILLNFKGTYHDVSTIAHELGHSMHSYYSNKNNPYQYSSYEIFVAEVASQVNELLLNHYMLEKVQTKEEKIDILNQILDLFKSSIYRQTMFAEFEKEIAKVVEDDEILTASKINNIYYQIVKKYFGNNVCVDEEIKYEWERIPHFYYDFYVYKYATGLAAAAHIVTRIINNEENALNDYLNFLKTGGSMYPLDELKIAGVDLTDPKVIQSAMDMFRNYLEKLKNTINS